MSVPSQGPNPFLSFPPTPSGGGTGTLRRQTSVARIQLTQNRNQSSVAHVATPTPRTQPSKARIQHTTARTQSSVGKVRAVTTQTTTSVANVQATTLKTQPSKARITATTPRTQPAKGKIRVTTAQLQLSRARIGPANLAVHPPAKPALFASYGGYTLDEANGIVITTPYDAADTSIFGNWYCRFRCRLRPDERAGDDDVDDQRFTARIQNLEAKLRIPRQELVVKFGSAVVRDWTFNQASQTAFLIYPELELLEENRRDYTYGFRVRCQFPGNIPNNAFRRESLTARGTSLRQNRTCSITATWTSSPGLTALQNYQNNGDPFFTAYLPPNGSDEYGNPGTWIRADELPVATNDEDSLCTATRVYWECFNGRRESEAKRVATIADRRLFTCPSTWVASPGVTALQNYLDGGDNFYNNVLPPITGSGYAWVLVDEEPSYNDQNGILTVVRSYHEVLRGNREYQVRVTTLPAQIRQVVVSGSYYQTGATSAYANYQADVLNLVTGVLKGLTPPVTRYEHKSVPKYEGYDQNQQRYFFTWTINELAYPQGPSTDDPNVTIQTLDLEVDLPREPEAFSQAIVPTRLQRVVARFTATVDYTQNQNPAGLWTSYVRSFVINAVATKLVATTLDYVDERVSVGLHGNTISGTLFLIVTNTNVIRYQVDQTVIQVPQRDFVALGDGTDLSAFAYRDVAEKILIRNALVEYVVGFGNAPVVFAPGDLNVSGFGLIDTGEFAQDNWNRQLQPGALDLGSGWFLDRRAARPFAQTDIPTTRGVAGFKTVVHLQTETWRYLSALISDDNP